MAVTPGSNSFYEIRAILASLAKSDDFFPGDTLYNGLYGSGRLCPKGVLFSGLYSRP